MSVYKLYIIFCLATAIYGLLELHFPVWRDLSTHEKYNMGTISCIIFFLGGLIFAPILFLACINPRLTESFKANYKNALTDKVK